MEENERERAESETGATVVPNATLLPDALVRARTWPSIVWLIPLVAAFVGLYLAYWAWTQTGPTITIRFETAEGLEAGRTALKYKDVEVGQVESVRLDEDLSHVVVSVSVSPDLEGYLTEDTRFWIVRARVSAGELSGIETVFSGAYIAVDPSSIGESTREFIGLEKPPVVTSDKPGKYFRLRAEELGSIEVGSPVYYRWLQVGRVVGYELSASGDSVDVQIFVEAPHDARIRSTTRFWNASGFDATLRADGLEIDTPSLTSFLLGGIAFETPATVTIAGDVPPDMVFELYPNKQATKRPRAKRRSRFLVYFDRSVAGLAAGSPVEFRGIEIGEVQDVELARDPETGAIRIPVVIEIEVSRLGLEKGQDELDYLAQQVERGLRARLATQNILTGQQAVDFDFVDDAPPARLVRTDPYPVLPTTGGDFDAITERVARIVEKLDRVPIESIGRNLDQSLERLAAVLVEIRELAGTTRSDVLPSVSSSLEKLERTLESADGLIAPESALALELERLVSDLSEAAGSIRRLTERLESHPEELLRGRPD
ncbi:MAG: MlaD family protein [Myxococcota bacterium]